MQLVINNRYDSSLLIICEILYRDTKSITETLPNFQILSMIKETFHHFCLEKFNDIFEQI